MVAPVIYRVRMSKGYIVTWYVVTKRKFLGREFSVGKVAFGLWMSDN